MVLSKLFEALSRSRSNIADAFQKFLNQPVTSESLENLEEQLLAIDMGYPTVEKVMRVVESNNRKNFIEEVNKYLVSRLPEKAALAPYQGPTVLMVVGVNGTGKTTSAAKLAYHYKALGNIVTLVAADTYRAAAVDQLNIWSKRVGCRLICNEQTSEPTAVLFDGLESARSNKSDLVIVDTAGRLHTSSNLMNELDKMYRVIQNRFSEFNVNSLITIDSSLGQNSVVQAKAFNDRCHLDGAILTKLDGTAKGGIIFPLFHELHIPVKFIGIGEDLGDLELFDREIYVKGLLGIGEDLE